MQSSKSRAGFDVLRISWCVVLGFFTGLLSPLDRGPNTGLSFMQFPQIQLNGILQSEHQGITNEGVTDGDFLQTGKIPG